MIFFLLEVYVTRDRWLGVVYVFLLFLVVKCVLFSWWSNSLWMDNIRSLNTGGAPNSRIDMGKTNCKKN